MARSDARGRRGRSAPVARRVASLDWEALGRALDDRGHARIPGLLGAGECTRLSALWKGQERFRKHVRMEDHRFGAGEYRYFDYPLPALVARLREALYPPLARIADAWSHRLGGDARHPDRHAGYLERCRARGQTRPTPLLLHYTAGGFNCLHQDLYGEVAFPLQVTVLLSRPERDFRGGEFLLLEQRPRQQSRAEAIALRRGEAIVFPTRERPVEGVRGPYRAQLRHGVSRVHRGERLTLGIIFHDAR